MEVAAVIREVLASMGIEARIAEESLAGQTIFSLQSDDADGSRSLRSFRGETLQALDHVIKKIAEKRLSGSGAEDRPLFVIDVDGERTERIRELQQKALMMAERARSFQYDVELSPMSAYERLIIHASLQDAPNVKTESYGEGKARRVVIRYEK